MKLGYKPKDERKTILFLSDDMRLPSGIGNQSKEIIIGLAHKYNFIQLGAGINHPDAGKIIDMSESISKELDIPDAYVKIYPYNGYGDANIIHTLIDRENPDAILHFTDPRQWIWLYQMEAELRQTMPIFFYSIWDALPYPTYNENFYRSCDWIGCISKQTYNIIKNTWIKDSPEDWQISYVPHGINETVFHPIVLEDELAEMETIRNQLFKSEEVDFVVLFNNRNVHRKMVGNVILAYNNFVSSIPEEQREKCRLLMHTAPVDKDGTDLPAVFKSVAPDVKVVFSDVKIESKILNYLYNIADVTINLASAEGFGLSTAESLMAGTPIIVTVTGGLQDQCGFVDENNVLLNENIHYKKDWGSNSDGKYEKCGKWAVPIFPSSRALIGSIPTPFIFDERCKWEDAADGIREVYSWGKDERKARGLMGREFVLKHFSATNCVIYLINI